MTAPQKPALDNKDSQFLNLLHPLLIFTIALSLIPTAVPFVSKDNKTFPQFQWVGHLISYLNNTLVCLLAVWKCLIIQLAILSQFHESSRITGLQGKGALALPPASETLRH